jgi:large subunit ribosomal protein L23
MSIRERMYQALLAPHVTEKSAHGSELNRKYVFKILRKANKIDIKRAVEQLFDVKVISVCICNVKGKMVRFKRTTGRRKHWKKAYVTLAKGAEIDMNENG